MSKRVLMIATGPRAGGNSELLLDAFGQGAAEAGHQVEKICLHDKTIGFCKGCFACQTTQRCVIKDDADKIAQRMLTADVIVFATPIYYYEMCGQMKTMLDRANPLFTANYAFREVYLMAAAADTDARAMDGAIKGLEGWVSCFSRAATKGVVRGLGVTAVGDIAGQPALQEAKAMGRNV